MDFLKKVSISEDTIRKITENNSLQCLFNLECNQEECLKIIKFMRNIGIKRIDDLLTYHTEIFIQSIDVFMEKIARYNIIDVIKNVNEDPVMIEKYMGNLKEA